MGITSLEKSFEDKFAGLSGELASKREEVARIEKLLEGLPALKTGVAVLESALDHGAAFMIAVGPGLGSAQHGPENTSFIRHRSSSERRADKRLTCVGWRKDL